LSNPRRVSLAADPDVLIYLRAKLKEILEGPDDPDVMEVMGVFGGCLDALLGELISGAL
jgi:hypothetical protein